MIYKQTYLPVNSMIAAMGFSVYYYTFIGTFRSELREKIWQDNITSPLTRTWDMASQSAALECATFQKY